MYCSPSHTLLVPVTQCAAPLGLFLGMAAFKRANLLQAFLGTAFLVEGLLFGFHLKGTALDMKVHYILVLIVLANSATCFLEIAAPSNFLLTTARAQFTLLQGLWFYQVAEILFKGKLQLDPVFDSM